jgi:hypothetical protein
MDIRAATFIVLLEWTLIAQKANLSAPKLAALSQAARGNPKHGASAAASVARVFGRDKFAVHRDPILIAVALRRSQWRNVAMPASVNGPPPHGPNAPSPVELEKSCEQSLVLPDRPLTAHWISQQRAESVKPQKAVVGL